MPNGTICARSWPTDRRSFCTPIRRYGSRHARGRDRASVMDCGVARTPQAAYVPGNVRRRDLAAPAFVVPVVPPEVPDGRHCSLNFPCPCPAGVHRCRAARTRRLPGRVPRPDPRGLHPGPAPVHRMVPHPVPAPVRGPPRGHRDVRPRARGTRAGPRYRDPPAVHYRRVQGSTPSRKNSSSTRPQRTYDDPGWTTSRTPPLWTATSSAPCWSPPGSARPPSTP